MQRNILLSMIQSCVVVALPPSRILMIIYALFNMLPNEAPLTV